MPRAGIIFACWFDYRDLTVMANWYRTTPEGLNQEQAADAMCGVGYGLIHTEHYDEGVSTFKQVFMHVSTIVCAYAYACAIDLHHAGNDNPDCRRWPSSKS